MASKVFTVWNKAVSGRLKSDCRISAEITYNNFPWAELDAQQQADIEAAADGVLQARAEHPEATLADLYDPLSMPKSLAKAHQRLDAAVLNNYGRTPGPRMQRSCPPCSSATSC